MGNFTCVNTWVAANAVLYSLRSRSEEHTSELQSQSNLVCRLLLEKKKKHTHKFCPLPLSRPHFCRPRYSFNNLSRLLTPQITRVDTFLQTPQHVYSLGSSMLSEPF